MSSKIKFYTDKEIERAMEVAKSSTNLSKSAEVIAKEFGRDKVAIMNLFVRIRSGNFKKANRLAKKPTNSSIISPTIRTKVSKQPKSSIAEFKNRTITIPIKSIIIQDNNLIITH